MTAPLMPKATAIWLIENTALTFEQIAEFCGLHPLEVQSIADGEVAKGIIGLDPVLSGQLAKEEVERCEKDPTAHLKLADSAKRHIVQESKSKKTKYTPVARRQDKPDAVSWLLKNCPELTDAQIVKLIGTTKVTIEAVRTKEHWNSQNIKPKDPVLLGLCSQAEMDRVHAAAVKKANAMQKNNPTSSDILDAKVASSEE
ncbi:MAG: DUF1013 domain-containing protein [Alphaproteobacteria bacterium]|jgi:hypothetical protein|nr:DUF1013 domain-containing protein [Candidatus Jidaibacter sp.]